MGKGLSQSFLVLKELLENQGVTDVPSLPVVQDWKSSLIWLKQFSLTYPGKVALLFESNAIKTYLEFFTETGLNGSTDPLVTLNEFLRNIGPYLNDHQRIELLERLNVGEICWNYLGSDENDHTALCVSIVENLCCGGGPSFFLRYESSRFFAVVSQEIQYSLVNEPTRIKKLCFSILVAGIIFKLTDSQTPSIGVQEITDSVVSIITLPKRFGSITSKLTKPKYPSRVVSAALEYFVKGLESSNPEITALFVSKLNIYKLVHEWAASPKLDVCQKLSCFRIMYLGREKSGIKFREELLLDVGILESFSLDLPNADFLFKCLIDCSKNDNASKVVRVILQKYSLFMENIERSVRNVKVNRDSILAFTFNFLLKIAQSERIALNIVSTFYANYNIYRHLTQTSLKLKVLTTVQEAVPWLTKFRSLEHSKLANPIIEDIINDLEYNLADMEPEKYEVVKLECLTVFVLLSVYIDVDSRTSSQLSFLSLSSLVDSLNSKTHLISLLVKSPVLPEMALDAFVRLICALSYYTPAIDVNCIKGMRQLLVALNDVETKLFIAKFISSISHDQSSVNALLQDKELLLSIYVLGFVNHEEVTLYYTNTLANLCKEYLPEQNTILFRQLLDFDFLNQQAIPILQTTYESPKLRDKARVNIAILISKFCAIPEFQDAIIDTEILQALFEDLSSGSQYEYYVWDAMVNFLNHLEPRLNESAKLVDHLLIEVGILNSVGTVVRFLQNPVDENEDNAFESRWFALMKRIAYLADEEQKSLIRTKGDNIATLAVKVLGMKALTVDAMESCTECIIQFIEGTVPLSTDMLQSDQLAHLGRVYKDLISKKTETTECQKSILLIARVAKAVAAKRNMTVVTTKWFLIPTCQVIKMLSLPNEIRLCGWQTLLNIAKSLNSLGGSIVHTILSTFQKVLRYSKLCIYEDLVVGSSEEISITVLELFHRWIDLKPNSAPIISADLGTKRCLQEIIQKNFGTQERQNLARTLLDRLPLEDPPEW